MLPLLMLPLLFLQSLGDDQQALKLMFFGDSVVSGLHNKESDICPFRYEFLRLANQIDKRMEVVGTNADPDGTCQKLGEELDVHNNGYQNAGIDELLDFVTADLQYLHKPVDYIFSSLGAEDCLQWEEGRDLQILSQSVRRIMGRLLNINENAKIIHIPIMLPEAAGTAAIECMKTVNQKLRDVYDVQQEHARIQVLNFEDKLGSDSFYMIGENGKKVNMGPAPGDALNSVVPPANVALPQQPVIVSPGPEQPVVVSPGAVVVPGAAVVAPTPVVVDTPEVVPQTYIVPPSNPSTETSNSPRRLEIPVMFLPKKQLAQEIAKVLMDALDWEFRAQTLFPTPEVTKEPDYYGYDWCMDNYEESVCFEYYYGYTWCLEEYSENECYSYYYGDLDKWGKEDSYKWCLNFYDEEYCDFAYLGETPDDWDWLSFGYQDCLKDKEEGDCFDLYYGYAWCVDEYEYADCYEYYYGGDDWVWNEDTSYNWCINFYSEDDCAEKYFTSSVDYGNKFAGGNVFFSVVVALAIFGCLVWVTWKKFNCFKSKRYSRLDPRDKSGEDEVELL